MQKTPPIICLDNNDYSLLSDPSRRTDELDEIRRQLLELAKSESVVFAFAGTHIMEMAPLKAEHTGAAAARADLLVALCGKNALISIQRLVQGELARVAGLHMTPLSVLTNDATWFPVFDGDLLSPFTHADRIDTVMEALKEHGVDRAHRRATKRELLKGRAPAAQLQAWFTAQAANPNVDAMLSNYPMRPEDAKVLARYALGHATTKEAEDAFLSSLRDPSWMMRWFAEHHDKMSPVTRWLREPSQKFIANLQGLIADAQEWHRLQERSGRKVKADIFTAKEWRTLQDDTLIKITNRLLKDAYPACQPIADVSLVDMYCPGVSAMVRTIFSVARDSFGIQPRMPSASDFADGVHAAYAPYVSIFRADSYMAGHVKRQVQHRGTQVVGKLRDLLRQINDMLR
ncbi:hypothetical protein ACSFA7_13765 [Variovorax sp. LT1R20]|uniref:hypothetical protein n=1 Tax=Variovorax sp. LT1R20 TaxID=3443729 RepID=UPI003F48657B